MKESLVKLEGITKSYDGQMILDDLNLDIYQNSFVTLLGPSGCGKTTTLRIIGGFETPDKGKVIFDGQDITFLPPHKRALNTVFQKYALFPNMTIEDRRHRPLPSSNPQRHHRTLCRRLSSPYKPWTAWVRAHRV